MSFQEIGLGHRTDKATTHLYMDDYEKYLSELRDKEFVLLEIGVAGGSSINMWREIFPKAKVYGIDNNADCAGEGIFIGSQTDTDFLDKVLAEIGVPTVIVDDGSHFAPYTIKTFEYLFPKINKGGLYFVEDTGCFYDSTYGQAPPFNEGMSEVFKFFSGLACDVDVQGRGYCGNAEYAMKLDNPNFAPVPKYSQILESMHIHCGLWLFKRRDK